MKRLKLLYYRLFKVITKEKAKELGLVFHRNVFGDEINHINCRSLWEDSYNRLYRVEELVYIEECTHPQRSREYYESGMYKCWNCHKISNT